jgi:hypothetical protein
VGRKIQLNEMDEKGCIAMTLSAINSAWVDGGCHRISSPQAWSDSTMQFFVHVRETSSSGKLKSDIRGRDLISVP